MNNPVLLTTPIQSRTEWHVQSGSATDRFSTLHRADSKEDADRVLGNYKATAHPAHTFRVVERPIFEFYVSNGQHRHGQLTRGWTDAGKPYYTVDGAMRGARRSNRGVTENRNRYRVVQMVAGNEVVIWEQTI